MRFTFRYLKWVCLFLCMIGAQGVSAQSRRKIDVATARVSQLKVLRPSGLSNVGGGVSGITTVEVRPSELLFERLDRPAIVTQNASGVSRQELPFRLYGVSPEGSHLDFGVVVDIEGGGMRPSPNAASFVGKLRFGIINSQNPASQQTLPTPVGFLVTADVDSIDPDGSVNLDHTNLPFVPVTLSAVSPRDTVSVQIRPSFSPANPVKVDINVIRPELNIEISPKSIQGWGLEEASITIRTTGLAQPKAAEVTLNATRGGLEKTSVNLDDNGVGAAKIRSIGLGLAKISAKSSRLRDAETDVRFTFPWAFTISAMLGGILGVLAKKVQSKGKKSGSMAVSLLAGIAIGMLGAVAYAVGVNLTGYVPKAQVGEALILFVAGMVSYVGGFSGKGE